MLIPPGAGGADRDAVEEGRWVGLGRGLTQEQAPPGLGVLPSLDHEAEPTPCPVPRPSGLSTAADLTGALVSARHPHPVCMHVCRGGGGGWAQETVGPCSPRAVATRPGPRHDGSHGEDDLATTEAKHSGRVRPCVWAVRVVGRREGLACGGQVWPGAPGMVGRLGNLTLSLFQSKKFSNQNFFAIKKIPFPIIKKFQSKNFFQSKKFLFQSNFFEGKRF